MNLHEAAALLDVHYQTLYRWVRDGSLRATKSASNVYEITNDEVERFAAVRSQPTTPTNRIHVRSWEHHVDRFLHALLGGDELAARTTIDRLSDGSVSIVELCENMIAPCLVEIGDAGMRVSPRWPKSTGPRQSVSGSWRVSRNILAGAPVERWS